VTSRLNRPVGKLYCLVYLRTSTDDGCVQDGLGVRAAGWSRSAAAATRSSWPFISGGRIAREVVVSGA